MKLLLVNTLLSGGAAKACLRLHNGLLNKGVHSELLTLSKLKVDVRNQVNFPSSTLKRYLFRFAELKAKTIVKLSGLEAFELLKTPYRIEELNAYKKADVVNFHWTSRLLDYPSFFKHNSKPIIWTLHDMQAFSGGPAYSRHETSDYFKKLRDHNIENKVALLRQQNIHVVCLSNWMLKHSSESTVFGRFPHYLIPNGINTNIYRPVSKEYAHKNLGINPKKQTVLFISESIKNERKGFKFLLEATKEKFFRDINLIAVGNKPKNMPSNISFTGYISDEKKLALLYNAADVFVIPSIEDNLPNTVVESLCCGTPTVGFNIGGIPDMVKPNFNGILSHEMTSKSLAESIKLCLSKDWDKIKISSSAHLKYNEKKQSEAYLKLAKEIIK